MASEQNAQVKALYDELVTSLAPTDDHTPGIDDFRAGYDKLCANFPDPEGATIEETDAGGVPVISVLHPSAMGDAVVLYFHGGGYVIGKAGGYKNFAAELSRVSGSKVLLVDYRLAPEDPYPAAVDDAVAAYQSLLDDGLQETDITLAGDSAGGGLVAATLLRLKDEGIDLPAGAVLYSPWCDLTNSGESLTANADKDPIIVKDMVDMLGGLYRGENDATNPYISALHGDLSGLPPLLIFVGTNEALLDDAKRLAAKAVEDGVEVTLEIGDDMYHIYPCFQHILPEGKEATKQSGRFIAEMTNSPTITS